MNFCTALGMLLQVPGGHTADREEAEQGRLSPGLSGTEDEGIEWGVGWCA